MIIYLDDALENESSIDLPGRQLTLGVVCVVSIVLIQLGLQFTLFSDKTLLSSSKTPEMSQLEMDGVWSFLAPPGAQEVALSIHLSI